MNLEKYIGSFIEVCKDVFKKQGGITISEGRPYITEKEKYESWDISAVIGFVGEVRGAIVISLKTPLALKIVDELTGTKHTEMDEETKDVIGEMINMIAGHAKQRMEKEFTLVISLPTIVHGSKMSVTWPGKQPRIICIPFSVFDETFTLSVSIEQA
ncbi:MAG: chemotaxis protein CheX [Treponemataceae bacterium]|nr:MAG: chemotaxis protein CheX [Treponemataceae bacterium]